MPAGSAEGILRAAAERAAFLDAQRTLVCATLGPEGRPHLAALWYVPAGGRLDCWTYAASQKARNLERNPRATLLTAPRCREPRRGENRQLPFPTDATIRATRRTRLLRRARAEYNRALAAHPR